MMNRKPFYFFMFCAGLMSLTLTGCPDRSYQRPVPDYGNMSDSGGNEDAEDEATASMKDE